MELVLGNLEKYSMLFIGSQIALTPENPGPVVISVEDLSQKEAYQVLFNIQMGALSTNDNLDFLREKIGGKQTSTPVVPTKTIKKKEVEFKKLLAKRITTVKSEVSQLNISDLKKIMELERLGKNRKKLVSFFDELYSSHTEQVATKLRTIENNSKKDGLTPQSFLDDLPDVLELEQEEVEIPLPDKE